MGKYPNRVIYVEVTLRQCIKYCIVNVFAIGLLLIAFTGTAAGEVAAVDTLTWNAWPSTIYYLALLNGPDGPYNDVTVAITAVDEYVLYINGKQIGTDNDWSTVEEYNVSIGGKSDVIVAVQVKNTGMGNGNGLMVDIKANSDWLGTSTLARRSYKKGNDPRKAYNAAWYYHSGDVTKTVLGAKWYEAKADFFLEITKHGFKQVMLGKMGNFNYTPDNHVEVVTGYPADIDIGNAKDVEGNGTGGIRLRRIEGENLALSKPAQEEKLTDGDLANGYSFNQDPVGITKYIDLEAIHRVNKMVLYTGGTNPDTWDRDSVRGYSVLISLDEFRYEEVGVLHEIGISNADEGGYDWYAIKFPEEWSRYMEFEITEPRIYYPNIGEVMIYGVGYVYNGIYESDWYDSGSPSSLKNYDIVVWDGDTPGGTSIIIQTKTKYEAADGTIVESDWSMEQTEKSFNFDSPEPALAFKYRVKLRTQDIDVSPEFNALKVTYSATDQPVKYATGYISPNKVPMGDLNPFEYTIGYNLNTGQNIKSIALYVPGESYVDSVYSTDANALVEIDTDLTYSTTDSLYIIFKNAVTNKVTDTAGTVDELKVYFRTQLLTNIHDFQAFIYNEWNNDGAGGIKVWPRADKSWTVSTSTILDNVLSDVGAVPKVFTPNGDNVNDFTVIEFKLAKVETSVKIKIYNTKGLLVATIHDAKLTAKKYYLDEKMGNAKIAQALPGYWNGKNEDGDLVPPGVYLYQVIADTDSGDKIEGGTVVVAY